MTRLHSSRATLGACLILASFQLIAAPKLQLTPYNAGTAASFSVSSVLVTGKSDAILVDAQFGASQAAKVVDLIRASGKKLKTIYISHGDPDFYFGLETIKAAYPDAKVVATAQTVAHIRETAASKLAFWGPQMGADAPKVTFVPEVLSGDSLMLEGQRLQIHGLDGAQPDRTFVWIPSIKAVIGGVVLFNNLHVWMADTQSPQSHADWLITLQAINALKPRTIVPGHALPGKHPPEQSATFTANYIQDFDRETAKAANSGELVAAMKKRYPDAGAVTSLELSAKVAKGEMKW